MNTLSLKQLRYFAAIARCGSYRAAAESLNLTQPPLTRQIQLLEEFVGARLFDRSGRKLRLTPVGIFFHRQVTASLSHLEQAVSLTQAYARGAAGRLRVGLTDDLINAPAYRAVLAFMAENRDITLSMTLEISNELLRRLQAAELDVILANLPLEYDREVYTTIPLPTTRIMVVASPDHPLAKHRQIRPRMLHEQPLLLMARNSPAPFAVQYRRLFAAAGIEPRYQTETNNVDLQLELVRRGLGLALLGEQSIGQHHQDLKIIPIAHPLARMEHAVIYRPEIAPPALERLVKVCSPLPRKSAGSG